MTDMNRARPTVVDLLAKRDLVFGRGAPIFYETPLHLVRGDGVWLTDADGRRYLDMYNNIPVVGHCNPRVVGAVSRQLATHNTHSRYLDDQILDYGERLLGLHDKNIESVIFACSGTEANEIAMRMARMATGKRGFLTTDATYHGNSELVGSLTRAPLRGRQDVSAFPFPQKYRPIKEGLTEEELCDVYLDEVRAAIDDLEARGMGLAGLLVCSIFANEGLPDVPKGFLRRACELVHAAGGLVIMDEVQAGFCRSGRWWGYEAMDVVPDIVTMGKPMGNGVPLAACAARRDLVELFRSRSSYFNTFAASPLHAAAGMAVIEEIESRDLRAQVNDVGAYLLAEVRKLAGLSSRIGDVRGFGLFLGVEWVTDRSSKEPDVAAAVDVANKMKSRGFLMSNQGALSNVLKIRPPLVFERQHADLFLETFADVLGRSGG